MYNCTNIENYLFIGTKKCLRLSLFKYIEHLIHCLLRFIGYITNIYPLPVCIISVFNFKYNVFKYIMYFY